RARQEMTALCDNGTGRRLAATARSSGRPLLPAVLAVGAVRDRVIAVVRRAPVVVAAGVGAPVGVAAVARVPTAVRPVAVILALEAIEVLDLGAVGQEVVRRADLHVVVAVLHVVVAGLHVIVPARCPVMVGGLVAVVAPRAGRGGRAGQ